MVDSILSESIGRVVATERNPTTTGEVSFWLKKGVRLKPFDFVKLVPPGDSPDARFGCFYAIIHEIKEVSDEPSQLSGYISADFGDPSIVPRVSRVTTTFAEAEIVFNEEDNEMPVPHGSEVHWPEEDGVKRALGVNDYKSPIPAGFITMSGPKGTPLTLPVHVDGDYLIGPEGAHLNISGISGLATKTSYAMFLLSAIQQKLQEAQAEGTEFRNSPAFVIFNVKGRDLLRIHEKSKEINEQKVRSDWEKCGLAPEPVTDVTYFYPYSSDKGNANVRSHLSKELVEKNVAGNRGFRYHFDVEGAIANLGLLFEDIDDPARTLVSCAETLRERVSASETSWNQLRGVVDGFAKATPDKTIQVGSWRRFARLFRQRTNESIFDVRNRKAEDLKQVPLKHILNCLGPGKMVVVDIASLPDYAQSFIVGYVIRLIRAFKLGDTTAYDGEDDQYSDIERARNEVGSIVLFADELNKFAPKFGHDRTLTGHLREISERGRSDGIILFGAEQFRTGVDPRVTGNSGTQIFGRSTSVEASRDDEIKNLPGRQGKRVPYLKKGELMVNHTRFSGGTLKIRFPLNAYRPGSE